MGRPRLVVWDDRRKVKALLSKRLKQAKAARRSKVEEEWRLARTTVFGPEFSDDSLTYEVQGVDTEDFDITDRIDIQYAFRNLRLIHSHMSSNPPVATARPQSSDTEDRRAASAAQHVMQWLLQAKDMHNTNDLAYLDCLSIGTGITYTGHDPNGGDPVRFHADTGEMEMEGTEEICRVPPDNFWPDSNARSDVDIHHTFEVRQFTEEECRSRWPDRWALIKRAAEHKPSSKASMGMDGGASAVTGGTEVEPLYDLYWYYEPGLPENGYLGRFAVHTEEGDLIEGPDINPNLAYPPPTVFERRRARAEGKTLERKPPTAYLPYQFVTDIDVPDRFWGRSALYYVAPAQRLMANIDSAMLEAVKAHGAARLVLPSGAKLSKDTIANTSLEVIQLEDDDAGEPHFIPPPGLPASMGELRGLVRQGVDDMWGVNENMFGQQSREQSAVNMQYAVNQGAMVRRRLFNKSIRFVRAQYKALLSLAIQHWATPKALAILGSEKAYDVEEFMNMDLYSGYEIDVEYGTHLPLDPLARRDELLKMLPLYQQMGISNRSLISAVGMADLDYVESIGDLSRDRAKEIIDQLMEKKMQVDIPSIFQDHEGVLAYLLEYVNTSAFVQSTPEERDLVNQHIELRRNAAAQSRIEAGGGGGAPPPGADPAAAGGGPPAAGGAPTAAIAPTPPTPGQGAPGPAGPGSAAPAP